MPVMRVLSHMTLKSKIHRLNYSGIWYTARHPHITEQYWSYGPRLCTPPVKIAGAPERAPPPIIFVRIVRPMNALQLCR